MNAPRPSLQQNQRHVRTSKARIKSPGCRCKWAGPSKTVRWRVREEPGKVVELARELYLCGTRAAGVDTYGSVALSCVRSIISCIDRPAFCRIFMRSLDHSSTTLLLSTLRPATFLSRPLALSLPRSLARIALAQCAPPQLKSLSSNPPCTAPSG